MPHTCSFPGCESTFAKASKLERHELTHTDEKPFACIECGKCFRRTDHLAIHTRSHAANIETKKPHPCTVCNMRFVTPYHLKRHAKLHVTDRPFACTEPGCDEMFAKHTQLFAHVKEAHSTAETGPIFTCDELDCTKTYDTLTQLKRHIKSHAATKEYCCGHQDCSFTTKTWTLLRKHISLTHKPTCYACGKSFSKRYGLLNHAKLTGHAIEGSPSTDSEHQDLSEKSILPSRNTPCTFLDCPRMYKTVKAMQAHYKTAHEDHKPYSCTHCDDTFAYKRELDKHVATHASSDSDQSLLPRSSKRRDRRKLEKVLGIKERIIGTRMGKYEAEYNVLCPVLGCSFRFSRQYDCKRHVVAYHTGDDLPAPFPLPVH